MKFFSFCKLRLEADRSLGTLATSHFSFCSFLCVYFFILFTSFPLIQAQAWNPSFKHFTCNQGLSSNRINCITQDKSGLMWFGTEDGLTRYDSYAFEIYRNDPDNAYSISNNNITDIAEEKETGNLWISTTGGLNYFNRSENRFYQNILKLPPKDSTLLTANINGVMVDHRQRLWICQLGVGVYCYTDYHSLPSLFTCNLGSAPPDKNVSCIYEDSKHNIWVGSLTHLYLFDAIKRKFYLVPLTDEYCNVVDIYEDSHSNLWVSTRNKGVFQIQGKNIRHFSSENSDLGQNKVHGTVEDTNGNMLFAVRDGAGLNYLDQRTGLLKAVSPDFYNSKAINTKALTCIYKDKANNIWIGTFSSGINFIDRHEKPFNHYSINHKLDGLMCNSIRSVFQDSDGEIWIGTRDGGGLSKFNPVTGVFRNFKVSAAPFSLNDDFVLSITEAAPGKLIIGTLRKGFCLFDKKSQKFYLLRDCPKGEPLFTSHSVYQLLTDRYGLVWVSSPLHTYIFDIHKNTFKNVFDIPYVRKIFDYSKDELFIISYTKGLYCYNRKTNRLIYYNLRRIHTTRAAVDRISDIAADSKGYIWLATDNGVIVLNPITKQIRRYNIKHGLQSNVACGLLVDNHDNIWISTTKGLAKFNPVTRQMRVYDTYDGLQGNDFEKQVCGKTTSGFMIFGGQNGFNYFHPDSIKDNPMIPNVIITDFKLFNKPVGLNEKGSPLKQDISFTKTLTLTYKQSVITFEFAAINFSSPENNQYAYKLDGLEDEWNYVGNKRSASYASLPSGKYTFRVKASNNDGVWNETGSSINITVLPPWWKTWWFRILILAISLGIFFNWLQSLNRQKQKLELMVKERTSQIDIQNKTLQQQKGQLESQNSEIVSQRDQVLKINSKIKKNNESRLQFFTNVSHEFRTPLSLIIGPVDNLISLLPDNEEVHRQLLLIKRNSNRLLGLVSELMDFRSIETQNMSLRLTKTDVLQFARDIANCFIGLSQQRNINYSVHVENDSVNAYFDTVKLEKIICNLISNAFKYTKNGGTIEVSMGTTFSSKNEVSGKNHIILGKVIPNCSYFELSVKDNGEGIDSENLRHVFREFYREPSTDISTIGTGIGLALTRKLVILHKGIIEVHSEKDKGSAFIVRIPTDIKYFEKYTIENGTDYAIDYSKNQIQDFLDSTPVYGSADQAIGTSSKSKTHLLIVEDNFDLRKFIASHFAETYRISEASNGLEGLKMAIKLTPDLIISDVMMPEMDGIELCKQLKSDIRTSHIPVILLTALSDTENQIRGLETGADDYVSKPFDLNVLHTRVNNLIQSRNKLRQLFSSAANIVAEEITSNPQDEKFLQKALDIVYENLSDPNFGVKDLVDKMFVSRSFMHRKLISLTNQSAIDFITSIRLKESLKLINKPNLSIMDIAVMVGFNDPKYFSKCFKRHFGKNPSEYASILQNPKPE